MKIVYALLLFGLLAGEDTNTATVRKFWDAFSRQAWTELDALVTSDYVHHANGGSAPLARFKAGSAQVHKGLSDYKITIDDIVAVGDRVSIRWTGRGMHTGSMFGEPPTGKQVTVFGMHIHRLVDGKIAEDWEVIDTGAIQRQVAPAPPR